jgi:alkylation response protein AidB-like acyl-CoA dehydrogenase
MRAVPTPDQEMLRETMARFAATLAVNSPADLAKIDRDAAWRDLAGLGVLGMRAREAGAPAASAYEVTLAIEPLAGALAPLPLTGALLAYELLALAGADAALLADLAEGRRRIGLLLAPDLAGLADADAPDGAVIFDGEGADRVLALARGNGGAQPVILAVDGAAAMEGADLTRPLAAWRASGHAEPVGAPLAADAFARWTAFAVALACADLVGVLRDGLTHAVDYAKTRIQYDVPIGSFQAVQHMCADMLVRIEAAASATRYAAWAVDALPAADALAAAHVAKSWCAPAGEAAGEMLMQVYGGIGQTWEHVAHLRARRVMLDRLLFGDEAHHLHAIADNRDAARKVA